MLWGHGIWKVHRRLRNSTASPVAMTTTKLLPQTRRWRPSISPPPTPCTTKTASSAWSMASTFCAKKPFTINPEQAQELYRLAEEKHLFLMEAFWIWLLPLYDRLREILAAGTIGELKQITCQYGFVASGARKDRKFNSGLGGGALLDIGIYNLGFLRILTGQDPEKVETKEVHINEYGTDDYSCLALTYPARL